MSGPNRGKRLALLAATLAVAVFGVTAWRGWPHLRLWWFFEPLGKNAQGYREYRHRATGIVFVRLPGGKFWIGAQKDDPNGPNYDPDAEDPEAPVHEVTLSAFLIAKYEVTQGQWKAVMGSNQSHFKGDDDRPVDRTSWEDIQRFKAKTGLSLPTDAQWEYACRGGVSTPFGGTGKLDDMGWYKENAGGITHPVGKKAPNRFGIYDMHGNVYERCEDLYDKGFYKKAEARETDPCADTGSGLHVIRGGGWYVVAKYCRSAFRSSPPPLNQLHFYGFRPAYYPLP